MFKKLIDNSTGKLSFTNGFIVSRQTTLEEVSQYFKDGHLNIMGGKSEWKNYSIRNVELNGKHFIFTFHFEKGTLRHIDFIVSGDTIVAGSWNDWNEEKELEKRNYYNDWLTNEIGNSREFDWGRVDAIFDKIGGSASIILRYATIQNSPVISDISI